MSKFTDVIVNIDTIIENKYDIYTNISPEMIGGYGWNYGYDYGIGL